MKIRNGFVSNSSSSSFLLVYDKTKTSNDPKDVVEYVKSNPYEEVYLKGWELSDGEDFFRLSEDQKSYIRRFPREFIKQNTGTVPRTRWDEETDTLTYTDCPALTAFFGDVILKQNKYEYTPPEVDMSDLGKCPSAPWKKEEDYTPEEKELRAKANAWYEEKQRREDEVYKTYKREALEKAKEDLLREGSKPENIVAEFINIDYSSCSEDSWSEDEFINRYFTKERECYDQDHFRMSKRVEKDAYAIFYTNYWTDTDKIEEQLKTNKNLAIGRCNKVFNTLQGKENMNLYYIGDKEKELLKDGLNKEVEYVLFEDPEVVVGAGYGIDKEMTLGYGHLCVCPAGENLPDFQKEIIKGKYNNLYLKEVED